MVCVIAFFLFGILFWYNMLAVGVRYRVGDVCFVMCIVFFVC